MWVGFWLHKQESSRFKFSKPSALNMLRKGSKRSLGILSKCPSVEKPDSPLANFFDELLPGSETIHALENWLHGVQNVYIIPKKFLIANLSVQTSRESKFVWKETLDNLWPHWLQQSQVFVEPEKLEQVARGTTAFQQDRQCGPQWHTHLSLGVQKNWCLPSMFVVDW